MASLLPVPPIARCSVGAENRWRRLTHRMTEDASAPMPRSVVAAAMPHEMLHDDEVVLLITKPSLWFVVVESFRFVVTVTLLGVLAVRGAPYLGMWFPSQTIAAVTAVICAGRLVWGLLVWSSHTYMLTNQRVVTIKGVLNTSLYQAHLRKMQRTVLYRPFYMRILGVGTIGFATAATETFDSTWLMVGRPLQTHEAIVAAINKLQ